MRATGRPAKTTSSIIQKLKRESIRLSQMQDIAGCRIIVANGAEQDRAVRSLLDLFVTAAIVDRRKTPSHGYRAVHVIAREPLAVEIQVRTALQQGWAEFSEGLSAQDPELKYGGGNPTLRDQLQRTSEYVAQLESGMVPRRPDVAGGLMVLLLSFVSILKPTDPDDFPG